MISEVVSGLVQGIYDVVAHNIASTFKHRRIKDYFEKNAFIQRRLEELIDKTNASRIYVVQFHNGGQFYNGNSIQRFSITYEAIDGGVASILPEFQGRLVSEYPFVYPQILAHNEYYINDISKLPDTNPSKQKWEQKGTATIYTTGIWDITGNLIGTINLNYMINPHNVTDEEKELVQDFGKLISGYIIPTERPGEKIFVQIVMFFLGLMCLSQLLWVLNNLNELFHTIHMNIGPMFDIIKSLL